MATTIAEKTELCLPGLAGQFALKETLDCGQAFRWRLLPGEVWEGVAFGRLLRLRCRGEDILLETTPEELDLLWRGYFDLDRDYSALEAVFRRNPVMRRALDFCPGMRVLRQDPWETLCSFIISANNNIPRIKGIVERLCQGWGEPLSDTDLRSFPSPEVLAPLSEGDLAPIRAGWRGGYLLDAARRVADGRLDLAALEGMDTDRAREELMTVKGVGVKVAQCVLLFGYGRVECVPVDVWMNRVLQEWYPSGLPRYLLPQAGIAQQVLFHYARCCPGALPPPKKSPKTP